MNHPSGPSIAELHVGDQPETWQEMGFNVEKNRCCIGTVDIVFVGDEPGIHSWVLRGSSSTDFGSIPTSVVEQPIPEHAAPHPNYSIGIDHLVLSVPVFHEGMAAVAATGVSMTDPQPFGVPDKPMLRSTTRMRDLELELIGPPVLDPSRRWDLWGLVITVDDIDATAALLGGLLRPIKAAVQPHRRIATVSKAAGSGVAIAFLSKKPGT